MESSDDKNGKQTPERIPKIPLPPSDQKSKKALNLPPIPISNFKVITPEKKNKSSMRRESMSAVTKKRKLSFKQYKDKDKNSGAKSQRGKRHTKLNEEINMEKLPQKSQSAVNLSRAASTEDESENMTSILRRYQSFDPAYSIDFKEFQLSYSSSDDEKDYDKALIEIEKREKEKRKNSIDELPDPPEGNYVNDGDFFLPLNLNSQEIFDVNEKNDDASQSAVDQAGQNYVTIPRISGSFQEPPPIPLMQSKNSSSMTRRYSSFSSSKFGSPTKSQLSENLLSKLRDYENIIEKYFREEYCCYLKIPFDSTNEQILEKTHDYPMLSYALENYKSKKVKTLQKSKKDIFKNTILCYDSNPLKKRLLKKTPKADTQKCIAISNLILGYANVIDLKGDHTIGAIKLLYILQFSKKQEIHEEIIMQIVKQTINCRNSSVCEYIWKLLYLVVTFYPVPENCINYVLAHVIQQILSYDKTNEESTTSNHQYIIYQTARLAFIRMCDRTFVQCCKQNIENNNDQALVNRTISLISSGISLLYCSMYEMIYSQSKYYKYLPIPLALYHFTDALKSNRRLMTEDIFIIDIHESELICRRNVREYSKKYSYVSKLQPKELAAMLLFWTTTIINSVIPLEVFDIFIKFSERKKYEKILPNFPTLHLNVFKYYIGFLKDILTYEEYNHMSKEKLCDIFGHYFVTTQKMTIDPYKHSMMLNLSPKFVEYCIDNLDVSDIYPLDPICTFRKKK